MEGKPAGLLVLVGSTLHRASVGQGPPGPDWLAISLGFWSGRALATGTAWAWAGLCLIHHHHHACQFGHGVGGFATNFIHSAEAINANPAAACLVRPHLQSLSVERKRSMRAFSAPPWFCAGAKTQGNHTQKKPIGVAYFRAIIGVCGQTEEEDAAPENDRENARTAAAMR